MSASKHTQTTKKWFIAIYQLHMVICKSAKLNGYTPFAPVQRKRSKAIKVKKTMLSQACRILQTPSSSSATGMKLCTKQREARWKSLMIKVFLMFEFLAKRLKLILLLGENVFQMLCKASLPQIPMMETPEVAGSNVEHLEVVIPLRVIRGEIVGDTLPPGEGETDKKYANTDPMECNHPVDQMRARANQHQEWWTCQQCLNRWERKKIRKIIPIAKEPGDQEIVTFGKHKGMTFQQVYQTDRQYCCWAVKTMEAGDNRNPCSKGLLRFARYVAEVQMMEEDATWILTRMA